MPRRAPTEAELAAILKIHEGYAELCKLGWQDAQYAPKKALVPFEVIELGSTGIHEAVHFESLPNRTAWIEGDAPSHPILIKRLK